MKRAANITCLLLVSLLLVTFINGGCKPKKASKCPSYENSGNTKVKYNKDGTVKNKRRRNESQKTAPNWCITYHPSLWH
ncbi:MAG: hypothetical protein SGJ10_03860 [Bacteroidota bacterium]|nr:hypothetical protein [Bacteroidota bacterium]